MNCIAHKHKENPEKEDCNMIETQLLIVSNSYIVSKPFILKEGRRYSMINIDFIVPISRPQP